jgi:hypothetical protein
MQGAIFGNPVTITTGSTPTSTSKGDIPTCPCNGTGNNQTDVSQDFFTVNGGGFTNEEFHFNSTGGGAVASFQSGDTMYLVTATGTRQGSGDNMSMTVMFYGTGPGSYTISDTHETQGFAKIVLNVYNTSGTSYKAFTGTSGTLVVTAASSSGQPVAATFSGTFDYTDLQSGNTQSVTISNGSIRAIRLQ